MAAIAFTCPACKTELAIEPGTQEVLANCPNCRAAIEAYLLPGFDRRLESGAAATPLADQSDTSCFFHPQKQAVRVCDGCGRLICALCDIGLGEEHLCPNCLSSGRKKGTLTTLEDRRTRWDSIVLSIGVLSILLWFVAIISAPAAFYLTVRHWNGPGGILGRGRARFVIGCVLSLLMLTLWITIFGSILFAHPAHRHA